MFVFLCLTDFAHYNSLYAPLYCLKWHCSILFYGYYFLIYTHTTNTYIHIYISYRIIFILSSVDRYLSCFRVLAIGNSTAMNSPSLGSEKELMVRKSLVIARVLSEASTGSWNGLIVAREGSGIIRGWGQSLQLGRKNEGFVATNLLGWSNAVSATWSAVLFWPIIQTV